MPPNEGAIGFYAGITESIKITGVIIEEPERFDDFTYYVLDADRLIFGGFESGVGGRVLIKANLYPGYNYSDKITVDGLLQTPRDTDSFSYSNYLAKDNIFAVMYYPKINLVLSSGELGIGGFLLRLKDFIRTKVETIFPASDSGIILGLLLGIRTTIDAELLNDFQRIGLTHILAISGYNIALIIGVVAGICVFAGRKMGYLLTCVLIIIFAFLTGCSASVIRASLMGIFSRGAVLAGRNGAGINAFLLSAVMMVAQNPKILLWDVSFQLSAGATFGILVILPFLERKFNFIPKFLRENLLVSLSSMVFTLPLTAVYFGGFSLVALIANVVLLPLIPLIMFFSFAGLIVDMVCGGLGFLPAGVAHILILFLINGAELFAKIPGAYFTF